MIGMTVMVQLMIEKGISEGCDIDWNDGHIEIAKLMIEKGAEYSKNFQNYNSNWKNITHKYEKFKWD